MFTRAVVRPPGLTFSAGLTSATEGIPDLGKALHQHSQYCEALLRCGLKVHATPPEERYPDGTFVEDTAVIAGTMAVITRPGAPTRQGEVQAMSRSLKEFDLSLHDITAPGTVDGGDICQVEQHFLIGLSNRTNSDGARQLAAILGRHGYTSSVIDIRRMGSLLHLKSGIAYVGDHRLVAVPELPVPETLRDYEFLEVSTAERYAANCVRVNDFVLIPAGYPQITATLQGLGYAPILLEMSEFRKMDGGLSCLSLRF